jgi:hypothetical protein
MIWNPFNKSSAKPEERRLPSFARHKNVLDPSWITGDVFLDTEDKNRRVYYAARLADDEAGSLWDVTEYSYSVKNNNLREYFISCKSSLREVVKEIAELNLSPYVPERGRMAYEPVAGLEGNFREFAPQCGGYINDKGDFVAVGGNAVKTDALLTHDQMTSLYAKKEEPAIATWKDYYQQVVNKKHSEETDWTNMLEVAQERARRIKILSDVTLSWSHKKILLRDISEWGAPGAQHYNSFILTSLLRTGEEIYRGIPADSLLKPENVNMLILLRNAIFHFAQKRFGLSGQQAKQVANLITKGPDPYEDKSLPLEKEAAKAAKKSLKPQPHSP